MYKRQDHEFNEVRAINSFDSENQVLNIGYKQEIEDDEAKLSVGTINFDESITDFFTQFEGILRNTDFKIDLLLKLKSCYQTGKSFKQGFKELLFWLFDEYGLIIFDPQDPKVKTILKPCHLYTSDAADERSSVDLGGRRIIKKKKKIKKMML